MIGKTMLVVLFGVLLTQAGGGEGKAEAYLTAEGNLKQALEVRDVQGGFAGFTGRMWRIEPDGSWASGKVFNEKTDVQAKGKLSREQLKALAGELAKYDVVALKSSGKSTVNPHLVSVTWGTKATLTLGAGQPLPAADTGTLPGRFSGAAAAVRTLLDGKKDK